MPNERPANLKAPESTTPGAPPLDPRATAIATWLGQFSRTLKTCRLYDAKNPTSLKFREDLARQMSELIEAHGAIPLEFTASEVRVGEHVVMAARAREDNFAMPFYRDGLRRLVLQPGTEARELDLLIDLVLRVTGRSSNGSEDLVTLLWDADLPHFDMSYVSSETDADLGDEGENVMQVSEERAGDLVPWPGGTPGGSGAPAAAPAPDGENVNDTLPLRSEDWLAGDPVTELDECLRTLETHRDAEAARFARELAEERATPLLQGMLALVRSMLATDLRPDDLVDMEALLDRLLHETLGSGAWADARETLACMQAARRDAWDPTPLMDQFTHPDSLVTAGVVRELDRGSLQDLQEFIEFARAFGAPASEWLMGIIALANHQRTRRTLVRAVTDLCGDNPERLAPWLADERWYVVRNAVLVVGSTEGGAPAGLFRPLVTHPEPRVRQEVVNALAHCDPDDARPLLLDLIHDEEPTIRSAALHQLGARRNPEAAAALLRLVQDPGFRKRPIEEVRPVASALGGCAGDEAVPVLEDQLIAPRWFSAAAAPYCQAFARCLARIGTPEAIAMLERHAESKTPATRDACRLVLKGIGRG